MWHALHRDGIDIGREQTARLMRLAGVSGKGKRVSVSLCAGVWFTSSPRIGRGTPRLVG
ncbi:hypothetical protein [Corynebacterium sp. MSK204]|uniref:hypothetical protein n=1 Tax=Corynebacterium sp. MSK204 TaxID=3050217 RepID=UPI00331301E0